ncbi:type II toxin-antitoxin system RelE/ParE family toxin, partial [Acinetobacter baumannii]|nr:type II toxin-antitoxin system RelE/ParE family toxin [Acinetobacter baumannii]
LRAYKNYWLVALQRVKLVFKKWLMNYF